MMPLRKLRDLVAEPSAALFLGVVMLTGCAAPGPPKSPSLNLPERPRKLTAERQGDRVILRFDSPVRTTDGQLIRTPAVAGSLCRAAGEHGLCEPVAIGVGERGAPGGLSAAVPVAPENGPAAGVVWVDRLPAELATGALQPLTYRVELRNARGRSAGASDPVFAAGGATPPPVGQFVVEGSRLGTVLRWQGEPIDHGQTDILIERIPAGPPTPKPPVATAPAVPEKPRRRHRRGRAPGHAEERQKAGEFHGAGRGAGTGEGAAKPVWLTTQAGSSVVLDADATDGQPYRYLAERRTTVTIGARRLELRSAPTPELPFTWRPVYAPPAPRDLAAAAFAPAGGGFAVDLVWEPVTVENLTGYRVYRQAADGAAAGGLAGDRTLLTATPVASPGFQDTTARPGVRYRYSVTAVDRFGNESAAVTAEVAGAAAP